MHELFYARLANREYDPSLVDEDEQVALTVCAYSEDAAIASLQERLFRGQLRYALEAEGFTKWDALVTSCRTVCRELFRSAAPSVGICPRSAAYYSLDIILEKGDDELVEETHNSSNSEVTPRLLEVNFMGDWTALEHASETHTGVMSSKPTHSLEKEYTQCDWVNDLFTCLGTSVDLEGHPRLVRL